jgi:hypothetical protein
MEFSHYDYLPQQLAEKVIANARSDGGEAEDDEG